MRFAELSEAIEKKEERTRNPARILAAQWIIYLGTTFYYIYIYIVVVI